MYKVTSKIIGSIRVCGKELGYHGFIIVDKLSDEISDLQMSKIIKVKEIKPIIDNKVSNELLAEEVITENKKNKKNKSILGGN